MLTHLFLNRLLWGAAGLLALGAAVAGMLLPLMATGEQIDSLYSILILDLCFIMPGFLILSFLAYRDHRTGLLLLPALHVLGFTLIFSQPAEAQPAHRQPSTTGRRTHSRPSHQGDSP